MATGTSLLPAPDMRAVRHRVQLVAPRRTPPQIAQVVVRLVSVTVAALQARWAGANERGEDQAVDSDGFPVAVPEQHHDRVAVAVDRRLAVPGTALTNGLGSNPSVIADVVEVFEAQGWSPPLAGIMHVLILSGDTRGAAR